MTPHNEPAIDRSIYVMPMFINLVVSDFAAAEALYGAAGFVTLATIPGPDGSPALVHLRRETYQDILMTHGEATAGTASASFAAGATDLHAVAARLRALGAAVSGPFDTPWFSTDVTFTDPDGNATTLTAPREADHAVAQSWVLDQVTGTFNTPVVSPPPHSATAEALRND